MIWKPKRFSRKKNLDKEMPNYSDIYMVQSEIAEAVYYGLENGTFAIIRPIGGLFCDFDKVPEAAKELDKPICDEVLEIYADIRSLGLERVW
ncbi:hypothetical protein AALA24_02305 [Anaerovoracaceae bacterium 42-11]